MFGCACRCGVGKVFSDGFSYALPAGWQALDLKAAPKTLRALASPAGDAAVTFSVQDVSSALSPDRSVQKLLLALKASAPQTYVLSRGPFVTASGLHGCRAVFDETAPGGSVHFVVCVFPGAGLSLPLSGLLRTRQNIKRQVTKP